MILVALPRPLATLMASSSHNSDRRKLLQFEERHRMGRNGSLGFPAYQLVVGYTHTVEDVSETVGLDES